jgi:hypothetical protein
MQHWSHRMTDILRIFVRRGVLVVLAALMAITMSVTPLMSRPAHAQGISDLLSLGGSLTNGLSSCAIETVGWIVCPTMRSIARLADYGFTYINQNFLKIEYSIASNASGTYKAWELMRTVANALFVVAFMVVIYSQITGRNSGGYSIKRILPRLIVCAILVNISYYLCVALVDVSNITGDAVMAVMKEVAGRVGTSIMPIGGQATGVTGFQDGTLTVITTSVMAKPGTAWVLLAPVAAVIVTVASICAAGLILLIMRKTVVAMLILASPILFVAYILPNLERFFFQALRLFIQLLLLYPIVALLLGAGQIVCATIVTVGSNDANYRVSGDSYFSHNGGSGSAITDLTASAAAVLPLLGVWFIFRNMSSIMSTAGSRLTASVRSRSGEDDKEAHVTGKATLGAASVKSQTGINPGSSRRQAFSRNRHRASLAGSVIARDGGRGGRSGMEDRRSYVNESAVSNAMNSTNNTNSSSETNQFESGGLTPDKLQDVGVNGSAGINGGADVNVSVDAKSKGGIGTMILGAKGRGGKDKDEKQVTAKDIFNNMNRSHKSKDSERALGGGTAASGGAAPIVAAAPIAPSSSYRAPEIAQNSNVVSGSSAGTPVQVIAVPVQVDASALLGSVAPPAIAGLAQPPVTGTEEKAKARAQKYLFEAENELNEDRNKLDILGHNDSQPSEPPHESSEAEMVGSNIKKQGDE